jgi:hypothetical protein
MEMAIAFSGVFFLDLLMNGAVNTYGATNALLKCESPQEVRLVLMNIIEQHPDCTLDNDASDAMSIEDSIRNEVSLCVFMHVCIATITHVFINTFIYIIRSIHFIFFLFIINLFVALPLHNKRLPNFIYVYIYINTFLYIYIYLW